MTNPTLPPALLADLDRAAASWTRFRRSPDPDPGDAGGGRQGGDREGGDEPPPPRVLARLPGPLPEGVARVPVAIPRGLAGTRLVFQPAQGGRKPEPPRAAAIEQLLWPEPGNDGWGLLWVDVGGCTQGGEVLAVSGGDGRPEAGGGWRSAPQDRLGVIPEFHVEHSGDVEVLGGLLRGWPGEVRVLLNLPGLVRRDRYATQVAGLTLVLHRVQWGDGTVLFELELGNTARAAQDWQGRATSGDVVIRGLTIQWPGRDSGFMEVAPPGELVLDVEQPEVYVERGRVPGESRIRIGNPATAPHLFTPGRRVVVRFGFAGLGAQDRTRARLLGHDIVRLEEGPLCPFLRPAWGPEGQRVPHLGGLEFRRGNGKWGWDAVDDLCRKTASEPRGKLESGEGATGLFHGLDWTDPNPGGDRHITPSLPLISGAWVEACQLYSKTRRERNADGWRDPDHGLEPWGLFEMAATPDLRLPYEVHTGPGGYEDRSKGLESDAPEGQFDGQVTAAEREQRAWTREDAAHACRRSHPELTVYLLTGSRASLEELRVIAGQYSLGMPVAEPLRYRHDVHRVSVLDVAQGMRGVGHGALGRQVAWPLHAMAAVIMATHPTERRALPERWGGSWWLAIDFVQTGGCTRARKAPAWGHANPPPALPDDSPEVVEQMFERAHLCTAAAAWRRLGCDEAQRFVQEYWRGSVSMPKPKKWASFATREFVEKADPTRELPQKVEVVTPRSADALVAVDPGGGLGHQTNAMAFALELVPWMSGKVEEDLKTSLDWAARTVGIELLPADDLLDKADATLAVLFERWSSSWDIVWGHTLLDFTRSLACVGWLQALCSSEVTAGEEVRR